MLENVFPPLGDVTMSFYSLCSQFPTRVLAEMDDNYSAFKAINYINNFTCQPVNVRSGNI